MFGIRKTGFGLIVDSGANLQTSVKAERSEFIGERFVAARAANRISGAPTATACGGQGTRGIHLRPKGQGLLDDSDPQQHVFRPAARAVGIYHEGFGMHTFRRLNVTWRTQVGAKPEAEELAKIPVTGGVQ